ncbi:MAG TPA: hypothetical protein VG714_05510 [Acidobacteriaceae bacterium]|nr:hypothetical protein [Acidobacteriaceae bacterium]
MTQEHDDTLSRTLAALRNAPPPEGMETRIAQRLAAHTPSPSRWEVLRSSLPAAAWLRGALTGAIVATAVCTLVFYMTRRLPSPRPHQVATATAPQAVRATPVTLQSEGSASPACSGPAAHPAGVSHASSSSSREEREAQSPRLIPASFAPSRPAPPAPLTAQERALVEFVRTATPAQLAALSPAAEQKSDAEREAAFQKFFAPSPELLALEKGEEATNPSGDSPMPQAKELHN